MYGIVTSPSILFVHGMWGDGSFWNRFRRRFERDGFDPRPITLLHHDIPQDLHSLRHAGIMDYVAQVRTAVRGCSEPPVVVGHSMGALVAQKVAEAEPLRGLVLLSPVAPGGISVIRRPSVLISMGANLPDALLRRPFRIPWRNARYGLFNTLSPREQAVVYRSFLYESGRALWEILRGEVVVNDQEVSCPVLVAVGSEDRTTPPSLARRIARKYGADYREYPGECHYLSASLMAIDDVTGWVMGQGA